ncbi:MAG: J domain-containing protein [Alphaproteobacteria bacterium]
MGKLDDIYDIRVKPKRQERKVKPKIKRCEWPDCDAKAEHRAPKSPDEVRKWRWFCLEHVRAYNKGWNFFKGMNEDEIRDYMDHRHIWDRPTWTVGTNSAAKKKGDFKPGSDVPPGFNPGNKADPFEFFSEGPGTQEAQGHFKAQSRVPARVRRSLGDLNLDEGVTLQQIKSRYKELLMMLHPDRNGGDRSREDRLQRVIAAYNVLRDAGYGKEKS